MTEALHKKTATVVVSTGEKVEVRQFVGKHFILDDKVPNAIADIGEFLRNLGQNAYDAMDAEGNLNLARVPVEQVLRECRRPIVTLLRAAVEKEDAWWAELTLADMVVLAGAVMLVNQHQLGKEMGAVASQLLGLATAKQSA